MIILSPLVIYALIQTGIRVYKFFTQPNYPQADKFSFAEIVYCYVTPVTGCAKIWFFEKESAFNPQWAPTIVIMIGIVSASYWISRHAKHKIGPLIFALLPLGMLQGIILYAVFFVHFISGNTLLGVAFPLFGFELLAPLPAILFILVELQRYHNFFQEKYSTGQFEGATRHKFLIKTLLKRDWISNPWFYGLFLPFIAIQEGIFCLMYQRPDAVVQAFTKTCEFYFSIHESCYSGGEHYLCSVAVFGKKEWVKPQRAGTRRGKLILVNRQLMVANAFEQRLEQRFPRFARFLRRGYDALDIPVTRWSRKSRIANFLYFAMKPLEWLFLLWLYLFDPAPENRIARQYLPSPAEMEKLVRNLQN